MAGSISENYKGLTIVAKRRGIGGAYYARVIRDTGMLIFVTSRFEGKGAQKHALEAAKKLVDQYMSEGKL